MDEWMNVGQKPETMNLLMCVQVQVQVLKLGLSVNVRVSQ